MIEIEKDRNLFFLSFSDSLILLHTIVPLGPSTPPGQRMPRIFITYISGKFLPGTKAPSSELAQSLFLINVC